MLLEEVLSGHVVGRGAEKSCVGRGAEGTCCWEGCAEGMLSGVMRRNNGGEFSRGAGAAGIDCLYGVTRRVS